MVRVFWLDGEDQGQGGVYLRSELPPFLARMRARGMEPVAIRIEDDDLNMEILYRPSSEEE